MQREPNRFTVPIERLRAECRPGSFSFETTASLPAVALPIGQDRAGEALEFGLRVPDSHYNIYVAGEPGVGRGITTENAIKRVLATMPIPQDWIYVHNFEKPFEPRPIALPPGRAKAFAKDVATLIESLTNAIGDAFDSDLYRKYRSDALSDLTSAREGLGTQFESEALAHGFIVQPGDEGEPSFIPVKKRTAPLATSPTDAMTAAVDQAAQPATEADQAAPASNGNDPQFEQLTREDFEAFTPEQRQQFESEAEYVQTLFARTMIEARRLSQQIREKSRELDRTFVQEAITPQFNAIHEKERDLPMVATYLDHLLTDIVDTAVREHNTDGGQSDGGEGSDAEAPRGPSPKTRWTVNVLVDRTGDTSAPSIHEHNPTYYNLMGRLEFPINTSGPPSTDFSLIKAGALHRANGGFLIIHARDMLRNHPRSWEALKRSLRTGQIKIENLLEQNQSFPVAGMVNPEPIPLNVKVIFLGDFGLWDALTDADPEFLELFKVRADFDDEMGRTPSTEQYYAHFVGQVAREIGTSPLDRGAVARIVEEGSRLVDDQTKLSTSLTTIRDLVIEAGYWAEQSNTKVITSAHVELAVRTRRRRYSLRKDKFDEHFLQNTLLLSTSGVAIGQINALSVASILGTEFGLPMRVTARTSPGELGVTSIERESDLSGSSYTKGVLILAGYLAGQFGQEVPLSLNATLSSEQTYGGIDGDSATLAEYCVLLSTLANVPIRQSLSITGSMNQWGEAQVIGGVNLKIEGFFDVCQNRGLTGEQGVIIPEGNVRNLMLRLDILQAVRDGAFHIFAVRHVDDAIELLMGRPAGKRNPDSTFLQGTVNALVTETLHVYAERVRRFRHGH